MSAQIPLKILKIKIIIAGEPGSGKSFIAQAADACVPSKEIGVSIGKISESFKNTSCEMTLMTWTITSGRPREGTHLHNASAAIIVCDVAKPETVKMISDWAERIQKYDGDIPLFFAVNNANFASRDELDKIQKMTQRYNSTFFPISTYDLKSARALLSIVAHMVFENIINLRGEIAQPIETGSEWV